jgi:hypothetical protein
MVRATIVIIMCLAERASGKMERECGGLTDNNNQTSIFLTRGFLMCLILLPRVVGLNG